MKTVSNGRLLLSILKKDVKVYSRNMIYLFLTTLSLVFFVVIFWLVPDTVEEEIIFAVSPPLEILFEEGKSALVEQGFPEQALGQLAELETAFEDEGLVLVQVQSESLLQKVVRGELDVYKTDQDRYILHDPEGEGKIPVDSKKINLYMGISFPPSFIGDAILGKEQTVTVYTDAQVPEELRGALQGIIREMAYQLAGQDLPVQFPDEQIIILGQDRLGEQISMREKMRPLIAFFMLMMETFALASLISNEVLQRTITALIVTPMRVWHFLLAKSIFGTILAMSQAVIILALVGSFTSANWPLLLLIVLLGSLLFTAVAMLVGAAGKDFIGQLMFSMLFLIPLMIPSFAVLFPGSVAEWVRALPSYPIVRLLYDVTIHGALWEEAFNYLIYAGAWVLVIYIAGLFVLKRKVASL